MVSTLTSFTIFTPLTHPAMRWSLPIVLLFTLGSCNSGTPEDPPNRWADERLWPVLEAQEHRDTDALCALLKHEAAEVREATALAFSSVQDTLGIPCLLAALRDEAAAVRATAVYALGFVADSLALGRMGELAMYESDTTVQRAYLSASFLALQRNGMLKDPAAILYYLESSRGHERVRAADVLRRLPDSVLVRMEEELLRLLEDVDEQVAALLVRGMGSSRSLASREKLHEMLQPGFPLPIRINALRAYSGMLGADAQRTLFNALADLNPAVRSAALDELIRLEPELDAQLLREAEVDDAEPMTYLPWFRLVLRSSDGSDAPYLRHPPDPQQTPYAHAEYLATRIEDPVQDKRPDYLTIMSGNQHPAIRSAVFQALVKETRDMMARSRFASIETQYARLSEVVATAINTGDAGLICATAELLLEEEPDAIRTLLTIELEKQAFSSLSPIRDHEAWLLLRKVVAKSRGRTEPPHTPPPFNHPISKEKLRTLKQGQRYRITTTKGTIVIATDVNDCPGSSLAFDSLVTADYYNGKAFHRMVPNFVVQGGCPRGDGYGGMDWTLRTEIGRTPFTAGSVGLASAGRDTESCQFFITHSATPHLDGRYTRFGEVVEGMDVVWLLQVGDVMEKVERVE